MVSYITFCESDLKRNWILLGIKEITEIIKKDFSTDQVKASQRTNDNSLKNTFIQFMKNNPNYATNSLVEQNEQMGLKFEVIDFIKSLKNNLAQKTIIIVK